MCAAPPPSAPVVALCWAQMSADEPLESGLPCKLPPLLLLTASALAGSDPKASLAVSARILGLLHGLSSGAPLTQSCLLSAHVMSGLEKTPTYRAGALKREAPPASEPSAPTGLQATPCSKAPAQISAYRTPAKARQQAAPRSAAQHVRLVSSASALHSLEAHLQRPALKPADHRDSEGRACLDGIVMHKHRVGLRCRGGMQKRECKKRLVSTIHEVGACIEDHLVAQVVRAGCLTVASNAPYSHRDFAVLRMEERPHVGAKCQLS